MEEGGNFWQQKFYSYGPRGKIMKAVRFQYRPDVGQNVFNLLFGDYDVNTDEIDDSAISNNGDYRKLLKTVALEVQKFVNLYPRAIILIRGSTAARCRLYQMGIASALTEIKEQYEVWGRLAYKWSPFEKGVNYEEFLVFKKIS